MERINNDVKKYILDFTSGREGKAFVRGSIPAQAKPVALTKRLAHGIL